MDHQTHFSPLLPEPGIVFLTGFMGSGKTHTGRLLAEALSVPFVDLDDLIESVTTKSISTLFADYGEANFRLLESRILRSILGNPVVATGGGAPCYFEGMQYMNSVGTTVFLDPSEDILFDRLVAERAHRPLLQEDRALRELINGEMTVRRSTYEQAVLTLSYDSDQFPVVDQLLERLRERE
ncbi:shikimate kinase [Lewinella sp. 4G2]|uniref:shikimate kinase n=1 Tax=Lewinella sp. 4G2 TaxID=1803372 RepID=UPI0007B476C8|nr:shikimate kinase [Lewinella sp. 4G2]OAV44748.1 hypothetical protein A3850_009710 [Lewinella sp. 4G2]